MRGALLFVAKYTNNKSRKIAFTLAEVLITLGIIGVVAVLVFSNLVVKYKVKVLENQFKKADTIIQQALINTANEMGYDSLADVHVNSNAELPVLKENLQRINQIWGAQFKGAVKLNSLVAYHQNIRGYGILGNMLPSYHGIYFPADATYILPDGMLISSFTFARAEPPPAYLYFVFDTNGPYKGPNRIGHDIFTYRTYKAWYTSMCNPTIVNSENQSGCYFWAHSNVNPLNKSGEYWEILFKPISYWRKTQD